MTLKAFYALKYLCLKNTCLNYILVLLIAGQLISCILTYLLPPWMKEVRQTLLQMKNRAGKGLAQASGQHLVEPKITYTGCD